MPGTPIQLGQGGGTDWRKIALIGGGIGVVALVILKKVGSGGGGGAQPPGTLAPNAALAIGQVESDLLNQTGALSKQLADQSTALTGLQSGLTGIQSTLTDPNTGLPFLGREEANNNSILNVNYTYLQELRQALYDQQGNYRIQNVADSLRLSRLGPPTLVGHGAPPGGGIPTPSDAPGSSYSPEPISSGYKPPRRDGGPTPSDAPGSSYSPGHMRPRVSS